MDGQLNDRAIFRRINLNNLINCWLGFAPLDFNTSSQRTKNFFISQSFDTHHIDLVNLISGMNHLVGKVSVIGQNENARSIPIQTTNWINPLLDLRQKIHDCLTSLVITDRGNDPARLIEEVINLLLIVDRLAFYFHTVARLNVRRQLTYHLAVYTDLPLPD